MARKNVNGADSNDIAQTNLISLNIPTIITMLLLFIFNANITNAQYNPYYGTNLEPPIINWQLNETTKAIELSITSHVDRTETFKVYRTESGIGTSIMFSGILIKDNPINLSIIQTEPTNDVHIEIRSTNTSEPAPMEFKEWEYTFSTSMFLHTECVCREINIATIVEEEYPLVYNWNIDTEFLKNCIKASLPVVFEFCDDTISNIDTISIHFDPLYNNYALNFDVQLAKSTDVFSGYIPLKKENGDVYLDTNATEYPNDPNDEGEYNLFPFVVALVAVLVATTSGCKTLDLPEKPPKRKVCPYCKKEVVGSHDCKRK